jgi:hypothetical protein
MDLLDWTQPWSKADLIALVAGVATFLNSVLVYFTLREMKRQRELSNQPEMAFQAKPFYVYNDENCFPMIWVNQKKTLVEGKEEKKSFILEVNNIGNGVAKNVKIQWNININDFIERLSLIGIENYAKVKETNNVLSVSLGHSKYTFFLENIGSEHEFIMPGNECKVAVYIPDVYLYLLSLILFIHIDKMKNKNTTDFDLNFPSLKSIISYENLTGKKYKRKFEISISPYMVTNDVQIGKEVSSGYIKVKKSAGRLRGFKSVAKKTMKWVVNRLRRVVIQHATLK